MSIAADYAVRQKKIEWLVRPLTLVALLSMNTVCLALLIWSDGKLEMTNVTALLIGILAVCAGLTMWGVLRIKSIARP